METLSSVISEIGFMLGFGLPLFEVVLWIIVACATETWYNSGAYLAENLQKDKSKCVIDQVEIAKGVSLPSRADN